MFAYQRRPSTTKTDAEGSVPANRARPFTRHGVDIASSIPPSAAGNYAPRETWPKAALHISAFRDAGQSLPGSLRAQMEPRFGTDFSMVRIHSSVADARLADSFGARAMTIGRDITFGTGQYRPATTEGRGLIAHELAHVVQNRAHHPSNAGALHLEPIGSRAEREAARAGALAGLGLPAGSIGAANAGVALTPTSDKVIPLISYSVNDWVVTVEEEKKVLALLSADPDLSATIIDITAAGMLRALLERVDEPVNRRDLLRLLGARLNTSARAVVEPIIQDLDIATGKQESSQLQYNLGRLGIIGSAAPFDRSKYSDLIIRNAMGPFSGAGATGVNPSERGYSDLLKAGRNVLADHINPVDDLGAYLSSLTPDQRKRQVELLVNQPISTNYKESYAGMLPSRLQVLRGAAATHRLEPELVTAIILAEQRDQSLVEDARDFIGGLMFNKNTSIGLGQVVVSTARKNDLFSDLLTDHKMTYATARSQTNHARMVWLLASDEFNIAAVARYIRMIADAGAKKDPASLPNTRAEFPGINLPAYANHSSMWPEDNVGALGMYYTSKAWTDNTMSSGWGWFVQQAYRDVKNARVF